MLRLPELRQHERLLVVRSTPRSGYSRHFDRAALEQALRDERIRYVFLGAELGGRPEGEEFYDERGRVRYDRRAASPEFQAGIARLRQGIDQYRVAVMCSEENPERCHRRLLVGRELVDHGIPLRHIRGDGSVEVELTVPEDLGHPSLFAGDQVLSTSSMISANSITGRTP